MAKLPHPAAEIDERLFRHLDVYQDVVLAGQTVRAGHHDCRSRWQLLAPHLPAGGAMLDVGSNFGWFGLQILRARPDAVVASVEADGRSAEVQHAVLRANDAWRVCLLTHRAGVLLAERFQRAGQRFAGVLCLSVLHWMADHREFLESIGAIAQRIYVELPDPEEHGAGVEAIRRAIGTPEEYLAGLFPDRPRLCLGRLPSHRAPQYPRQFWLVGPAAAPQHAAPPPSERSATLDAAALLDLAPGWPPRSWWLRELDALSAGTTPTLSPGGAIQFTPHGLRCSAGGPPSAELTQLRRAAQCVPERRAMPVARAWYRHFRRGTGNLLRSLRRWLMG